MLDDRSYMREGGSNPYRSITVWLLLINAAVYLVQAICLHYTQFSLDYYFALSRRGLMSGFLWQLITFQFMHAGLMHLLLNSLIIYVFGRSLEGTLGKTGYLKLYLLSGVLGGLFQTLGGYIMPSLGGGPVVGASAGAFGLVAAFATLNPNQPLTVLLAFIIPVTMRAKFLLYIFTGLALFGILFPGGDRVAHAAHLGGLVFGVIYIRVRFDQGFSWLSRISRMGSVMPRPLVGASIGRRSPWRSSPDSNAENLESEEFISREVDPILDKISAHGIHSLTARERQVLEAARKKMARRT